jgi:hypothetical protein
MLRLLFLARFRFSASVTASLTVADAFTESSSLRRYAIDLYCSRLLRRSSSDASRAREGFAA